MNGKTPTVSGRCHFYSYEVYSKSSWTGRISQRVDVLSFWYFTNTFFKSILIYLNLFASFNARIIEIYSKIEPRIWCTELFENSTFLVFSRIAQSSMISKCAALYTWNDIQGLINVFSAYMQNIDVVTQAVLSQCETDSTWLAAELIKNASSRRISSSEQS